MTDSIQLGVNIDHIATLRQARGARFPDPVQGAFEAEQAGADSITVHLREDRRHIQVRDVRLLRDTLTTRMNLEMAITAPMLDIAAEMRPQAVCLVPERREELTTEGGLDVASQPRRVQDACQRLADGGARVSLFIDPDAAQIQAAVAVGAPVIEIHTGAYANASSVADRDQALQRIKQAARAGLDAGLIVHAGHGLTYHNVQPVAAIPGISELNIGHAIIAQALFSGLGAAVRRMKDLMREARPWA